MEVGLVSCTKSKREGKSSPKELYTESAYFRKARAYCERNHDEWYILSAKYHLLKPDGEPIAPYDETLTTATKTEKQEWAETVKNQLDTAGLLDTESLVFHAGKDYYEELLPLLEEDVGIQISTEGLMFGETLSWYNDQLD